MATYQELRLQAEDLSRQADDALLIARAEGIEKALIIVAEFGLTAVDLGLGGDPANAPLGNVSARKTAGTKFKFTRAPKYQDPITGITWSGAGRQPKWIGDDRDKFLIPKAR